MSAASCKRCGRSDCELIDSLLCFPCEVAMHERAAEAMRERGRPWCEQYLDRQAAALLEEVFA